MNLLRLALNAGLPVIQVSTEDTLNAKSILEFLVKEPIGELNEKITLEKTTQRYCLAWDYDGSIDDLYSYLIEAERTVILVNCPKESPLMFNAGVLPVPQELVIQHLSQVLDEKSVLRVIPALGGLSLKEISEIGRMAMAHFGSITAQTVMAIRKLMMSRLRGVFQVDTDMAFYFPMDDLEAWCDTNAPLFLHCEEARLVPRGLLLEGPPGTGKTAGAKYLANRLQVPLWGMDLGSTMGKYVGESEGQLTRNLQQIDAEAPGVLLLDEVEKIFKGNSDEGVTTRMLSKLLWWLQEHRTKILTVMTTNDKSKIPPELYREGRVDQVMMFSGLDVKLVPIFTRHLLASFNHLDGVIENTAVILDHIVFNAEKTGKDFIPQATITQWTYNAIKELLKAEGTYQD